MKRLLVFGYILLLFAISDTFAQKFGYVDTQYVLSRMTEYKEAQTEIETLAKGWEAEIQTMYKAVEEKEAALQAEEVLLTAEMMQERRMEIDRSWKEVKEYQKQIFGFDGLYFLKKKELIKPVQDQVFDAVEKVAKNNRLQIVFDKSGDLVMIYTDPIHDYTDYVIEELGLGENNGENN
ncbi:MAG: outer membrane chaperone Skp [Flammeovirgaceae bacterium]|nr:outer membrane chaperone Skp [Flammeovirgaceae bacterium]MBE63847.1 outer membrane chaperone Skp [Flammeovirgaceae bacterium]HCX23207.1 outer membrane chaperone Skp [Cytophagales bacterium]|tara:strand:- start:1777 stop:2313 length:537 start_codon:yes stop_codon:yes gene_type:complete